MPDKTTNVRNHLQKYIILIGDAVSKQDSIENYGKLLESLNQLAETTEEYYWKNKEGKMPALKKEDIVKIRNAYKEVIKNCNRMLVVPENELKGVHVLVDELSVLLSRDEAALDVATQDKNMSLPEILEHGRAITVDIGDQPISTTGNQMSSRIPLQIEGNNNTVKKGFFTQNAFADPLVNRDQILTAFRQKYPQMSEIFDCMEKCDRDTFGGVVLMQAEDVIRTTMKEETIKANPEQAKKVAHDTWRDFLKFLEVPVEVSDKYKVDPQYPKMMMEFIDEMSKQQKKFMLYVEGKSNLCTDIDANIDKRNSAMSAMTNLIGKPNLLAKAEPMIMMQNGKAVAGTFMENAVGKDAYHLPEGDPMREYDGDVYDNPEVFADIAAMQALDYICGNIDRHEGNMFYQFGTVNGKQKLIGITGIDNDLSFGTTPVITKGRVGNTWIKPEQFGVLDANTAQNILAINQSVLQTTLRGYGLSEKEINAAWERTKHLQEKIMEGLEHFKDRPVGEVEPGFLRIVPADEWQHYNREALARVGENQFKILGDMPKLIQTYETEKTKTEKSIQNGKELINDLFQIEPEIEKEKPPVPVGRVLGYGTMLKEPVNKVTEPLKLVVPKDTALDFAAGAINKRFAFSYEDKNGNEKECFFTKANTLEVNEKIEKMFDGFIQDNPQYEDFLDRMRAYYLRTDSSMYSNNKNDSPDFEELGYDEVEAEALKKDMNLNKLKKLVTGTMNIFVVEHPYTIQMENRTLSARVDMRNVAMNQMGDLLGVPSLLARAVPAQVQMGENVVDGIVMERAEGVDLRNVRKGDFPATLTASSFDGEGLKSVADLQVLDYICMNLDRHPGNMIYKFEGLDTDNPKFVGVQGIDNDLSFMGTCPAKNKNFGKFDVALQDITVMTEEMANKIRGMKSEDITDALAGTTLNKKEIIAAQQRLVRIQEALENNEIRVVSNAEWKQMKLQDLATRKNLFGHLEEAREKILNPPDKSRKTISFEKIERVEQFEQKALDNREIDKYMSAAKEGFEKDMLEIAKSSQPLNEMEEKDLFFAAKENVKLLSKLIDKADPALMKSSQEFKAMKAQCERTANQIRLMEREMKQSNTTTPSAEQSQRLFENIVVLKRTANLYEMYKTDALGDSQGNKIEQARLTAAKATAAVTEKLCVGFRANEKVRNLELHTNRTVTREIKTVINDMKSPDFNKGEYGKSFAKIIYLKTIVENSGKLKKSHSLASALNEKAVEKAVKDIMKSKAFALFMNRPQENLLNMLETKNGVPFYQQFRRDNATVLAETAKENQRNIVKEKAVAENQKEVAEKIQDNISLANF